MKHSEIFEETDGLLSYALLYAPEFPADDDLTFEKVRSRLVENLDKIQSAEPVESTYRWVVLAKQEVLEAFQFFQDGDEVAGCGRIQKAQQYLANAKSRKQVRADFIAGDKNFGVRGPMTNE